MKCKETLWENLFLVVSLRKAIIFSFYNNITQSKILPII